MRTSRFQRHACILLRYIIAICVLLQTVGLSSALAQSYEGTVYEAENAILENVSILQTLEDNHGTPTYSGAGFVGEFDNSDGLPSAIAFEIDIPAANRYRLTFHALSPHEEKRNHLLIDNRKLSDPLVTPMSTAFEAVTLVMELAEGRHTIRIEEYQGFFYLDALTVVPVEPISIQPVTAPPVDPHATPESIALKAYLNECYGQVVLSGQQADGIDSPEIKAIYGETGKYPAIMGFDFLYTGKTASENIRAYDNPVQSAIDWWERGGIVTFCWHWLAPKDNPLGESAWNKTFETAVTSFDLGKALSGEDPEGYQLLLDDIDAVASQLDALQKAGVPVLWRPLHEASGGWFWWGGSGPEAYKALWNLLYDRMLNVHGLHNLLWVWSAQHNDTDPIDAWYPGDATVDIIGEDIYPRKHDHSSLADRFLIAQTYTRENKIIALTESGVVPDPDLLARDGSLWAWFLPWYREYVVDMSAGYQNGQYSGEYTDAAILRKAYNHELVITLDELPKLKEPTSRLGAYITAYACLFVLLGGRSAVRFFQRRRHA